MPHDFYDCMKSLTLFILDNAPIITRVSISSYILHLGFRTVFF